MNWGHTLVLVLKLVTAQTQPRARGKACADQTLPSLQVGRTVIWVLEYGTIPSLQTDCGDARKDRPLGSNGEDLHYPRVRRVRTGRDVY